MPENKNRTQDPTPPDDDLALLREAARQAGRVAMGFFGQNPQVWMKAGDRSPVSEADFAVDACLKQTLLQARPGYGWISEESTDPRQGSHARSPAQRAFVVDPIDGTRGFINNARQWCISIAVIERGRPVCGVLECPAMSQHYSADSQAPAKLNDTVLPCFSGYAQTANLADTTGQKIRISCAVKRAVRMLPSELFSRMEFSPSIPSLAYRLALIAAGHLDVVVVRPNAHDWDIAAADVILQQTGYRLMTRDGSLVSYGKPPFAHDFLLAGKTSHCALIAPHLNL